ncbi:MAG: acyl-CoA thioester hydrolase [Aliidiomarina sp.]|uniref:acyl-CoA thioester hydrolase/BAAT C-terminal domain-containing protein n=1 Tax=Aliidiomarina sp. TaxID=1872439 RepID=UPI0025C15A55|nr:acyl-CoA thioester hydrolase/BAAT C-terminal domain-containing protein [Aliidiomarina sp.]MCH8502661.1 acyl-CoA thioester hydrolase [Aliidiomarina sp.]
MKNLMTLLLVAGTLAACSPADAPDIHTKLIDDGESHPLVILLGGSEGGNYFANSDFDDILREYHEYGMSVAAMGYFRTENTPRSAAEISLNVIDQRIAALARNPAINENCIALVGFSKGAELALLLGSHFDTATQVVAAFPSHVTWNAVRTPMSRSSWRLHGEPLAYINAPLFSLTMQSGNFTGEFVKAFTNALEKASPEEIARAQIPVENINGPVLLVSGKQDEIWPSHLMANAIEARLEKSGFAHPVKHIANEGGHYSYDSKTSEQVLRFLQNTLVEHCHQGAG